MRWSSVDSIRKLLWMGEITPEDAIALDELQSSKSFGNAIKELDDVGTYACEECWGNVTKVVERVASELGGLESIEDEWYSARVVTDTLLQAMYDRFTTEIKICMETDIDPDEFDLFTGVCIPTQGSTIYRRFGSTLRTPVFRGALWPFTNSFFLLDPCDRFIMVNKENEELPFIIAEGYNAPRNIQDELRSCYSQNVKDNDYPALRHFGTMWELEHGRSEIIKILDFLGE